MANPARILVVGDDFFFRAQADAKPSRCSCSMAESDEEVIFLERLAKSADAAFSTGERWPNLSPNSREWAVPKRGSLRVNDSPLCTALYADGHKPKEMI